MKKIKAFDIDYDTDGLEIDLPSQFLFEVEKDFDPEYELADLISDNTGWLVTSCDYEYVR